MLKEQALSNLQDKQTGLMERQAELETTLREKQTGLLESESAVREQRTKAQRTKDKVKRILYKYIAPA